MHKTVTWEIYQTSEPAIRLEFIKHINTEHKTGDTTLWGGKLSDDPRDQVLAQHIFGNQTVEGFIRELDKLVVAAAKSGEPNH